MAQHSVSEAKNRLPELIDRALAGEGVVITRHGKPVAEIVPIPSAPRTVTGDDLDWFAAQRAGPVPAMDAVTLVSQMRDDGER